MRVHLTLRLKIGQKDFNRSGLFKINPDLYKVSPDKQVATIARGWLKSIRLENDQAVILIRAVYNGNHDITNILNK